ncbi:MULTISPECIES: hypothetical protein [Ochrobactrum]|nr:hypothetical protein [[Ochrobactrum] soli]MCI1001063.1 hypothetical protein [Ochrobactrum sp. C6C9]
MARFLTVVFQLDSQKRSSDTPSAIISLFVFDGAVKTGDGFGFPSLRLA